MGCVTSAPLKNGAVIQPSPSPPPPKQPPPAAAEVPARNDDTPTTAYLSAESAANGDEELRSPFKDSIPEAYEDIEGGPQDDIKLEEETKPADGAPENSAPEPLLEKKPEEPAKPPPPPTYCQKVRGKGVAAPPRMALSQSAFSFLGSFTGISVIALLHINLMPLVLPSTHFFVLIGAYGAMAVLVFSQPAAPLSQPKNVILGNTIGGVVGLGVFTLMGLLGIQDMLWLASGLAVGTTIVVQELCTAVHPPGGATALLYVSVPGLQTLGLWYPFAAFNGAVIMVIIALFTNNLSEARSYPMVWPFVPPADASTLEVAQADPPPPEPSWLKKYFRKFKGQGATAPPRPHPTQHLFSFLGSSIGMAILGALHVYVVKKITFVDLVLDVGSFGAMSVLIFSAWPAPLAQPKNCILGNMIGGFAGVTVCEVLDLVGLRENYEWFNAALAVAFAIFAQEQCAAVHPPGGATSLIFVLRAALPKNYDEIIHHERYWYVICPALVGALVLVFVGVITNNISTVRSYPQRWL